MDQQMQSRHQCHVEITLSKALSSLDGLEPPTFRLTAERTNRLLSGDILSTDHPSIRKLTVGETLPYGLILIATPVKLAQLQHSTRG